MDPTFGKELELRQLSVGILIILTYFNKVIGADVFVWNLRKTYCLGKSRANDGCHAYVWWAVFFCRGATWQLWSLIQYYIICTKNVTWWTLPKAICMENSNSRRLLHLTLFY